MQAYLKRNKTVIAVCIVFSLLVISIDAIADDATSLAKLNAAARLARSEGWGNRSQAWGRRLNEGSYYVVTTTLFAGNKYLIVGAGDNTVEDLDIQVYDENENIVAQDQKSDALPVVEVTPRWNGTFYIVVKMYSGYGYSNVAFLYRSY